MDSSNKSLNEIQVLLPLIGGKTVFDYSIPQDVFLKVGDFVSAPFRRKEVVGVVWSFIKSELPKSKVKSIIQKYDLPSLTDKHIKFIRFIADYTVSDIGAVLKMMMPLQSSFKFNKIDLKNKKEDINLTLPCFTQDQHQAVEKLISNMGKGYQVTLLDGVTGSGKTEVYFAAIYETLKRENTQVLVLLPEIMLTMQLVQRFEERFGFKPAKWHSEMSPSQKKKLWLDILTGNERLIIGARSALFLPYDNLSLIVVDEEHDISYKQEEGVIYNARDAAVACGYIYNFPVILSSATPSIETLMNVKLGKYSHITLSRRYGVESMPEIKVVDMRQENLAKNSWLSEKLICALKEALSNQKQVMLFLNRRGYAPITLCKACGYKYICNNCSAYLVSHQDNNSLICHHCGFTVHQSNKCINCAQDNTLIKCGPGVERIAEEVKGLIPDSKIQIITKDTIQDAKTAEEVIESIFNKSVNIIIGTQMISKGHDFPDISVVGIIDADLGLTGADLRSAERTYHLLTQMSGRAGRRNKGTAFIQTYYPDNPILKSVIHNNRDQFTNYEMQTRKVLNMPPFGKLSAIILSCTQEAKLQNFANMMLKSSPVIKGIVVLGPVKAPLAKIRNRYRYRFLIKSKPELKVQKFIRYWLEKLKIPNDIRVKIDIDPYNFL
jgi:primosomal protein N' (replication factor Y)